KIIHINKEKKNTDFKIDFLINSKYFESEVKDFKSYLSNSLFRAYVEVDTTNNTWKYRYSFHPYEKMSKLKESLKSENEFVPIQYKEENKIITLEPDNLKFGKFELTVFAYDFSSLVNQVSP